MSITRPNCALDRCTILCLYVPGFHRQVLEHVPKCNWNPLTKFQRIARTNTFNVSFVGTPIMLRILQRAKIYVAVSDSANVRGVRKCEWIPQIYTDSAKLCGFRLQFADSAYNLRNPLTICGLRLQFADSAYNLRIPLTVCGFRDSLV